MFKKELLPNKNDQQEEELSELDRQLRNDPFLPKRDEANNTPMTADEQQEWQERQVLTLQAIKKQKAFTTAWKVVAGIVGIVIVTLLSVWWQRSAFSSGRVVVKVAAPTAVEAVQEVEFTVSYENNNRAPLENAELNLYYPPEFVVSKLGPNMSVEGSYIRMKIGEIQGHGRGKVTLVGKFFGGRNTLAYVKAVLRYTPSDISSAFESSSQATLALRSSVLAIDIDTPLEVAAGSMVEYLVTATNTSEATLSNMRLQMTPPEGFVLSDAAPRPSEGETVWYIGTIAPHQKNTFRISGTLTGAPGDVKVLKADFGVVSGEGEFLSFAEATRSTKVTSSSIAVTQTVNGVTKLIGHPGDRMVYAIHYRNQSSAPLRNLVVTFEIHSELFDLTQLQADGGSFDPERRTITWRVSDHPQLAVLNPGESDSIQFTAHLYNEWSVGQAGGQNPVIVTVAKVDSPDIPTPLGSNKVVASNRLSVPVTTKPTVAVQVSPAPADPNDPPIAENEYRLNIKFLVENTSNALKNARVTAALAPNVYWMRAEGENERVSFNERTNEVSWDIGAVDSGAGTLTPTRTASFRVSFRPAPSQLASVRQSLLLANRSVVLTGTDVFTQEVLRAEYQSSVQMGISPLSSSRTISR